MGVSGLWFCYVTQQNQPNARWGHKFTLFAVRASLCTDWFRLRRHQLQFDLLGRVEFARVGCFQVASLLPGGFMVTRLVELRPSCPGGERPSGGA